MTTIIYTTQNCPGCKTLKSQYQQQGKTYQEIVIGKDISREEFMSTFPGVKQVPFVVEMPE